MSLAQEVVGMAEIRVSAEPTLFSCLGLGSCVGIIAFDPAAKIGGLAHVMLPGAFQDRPTDRPGKFADTAIPAMIDHMVALGATRSQLVFAIVGGAQVFQFGGPTSAESAHQEIGTRNVQSVLAVLAKMDLTQIAGQETGGSVGRAVTFNTSTGEVRVRTLAKGERVLCNIEGVLGGLPCRQR